MKNIILIISFLFCTVSIVYAQKQPFLKDSWKGDMTSIKQEKGNSRLGFSFEKGNSEKLFVEVKQTQEPQLVVVRIDFSEKADKAYVFYSPTAASVPDLENAEYTLSGKFDFDRIRIIAEKGSKV